MLSNLRSYSKRYGKQLTAKGDEKEELGKQMWILDNEVTLLARGFKQKHKEVAACEKMLDVYKATPTFGSEGEAFRQLYAVRRACRNLQTKMQRNQAVIGLMQRASVTAVEVQAEEVNGSKLGGTDERGAGPPIPAAQVVKRRLGNLLDWGKKAISKDSNSGGGGGAGDRSSTFSTMSDASIEDWGDDDDIADYADDDYSPATAAGVEAGDSGGGEAAKAANPRVLDLTGAFDPGDVTAVALYDYAPQNDDELNLTAGDKIQVTNTSADWWTGVANGMAGIFPESYVRRCDPAYDFDYQAVYDYDAAKDDELTIKTGDLLALIESDDSGWTEAVRAHDGAIGIVPTEYIEAYGSDAAAAAVASGGSAPTSPAVAAPASAAATSEVAASDGFPDAPTPAYQAAAAAKEPVPAAAAAAAEAGEAEAGAFGDDGDAMLADMLGDDDDDGDDAGGGNGGDAGAGAAAATPAAAAIAATPAVSPGRKLPTPPPAAVAAAAGAHTGMGGLPKPKLSGLPKPRA